MRVSGCLGDMTERIRPHRQWPPTRLDNPTTTAPQTRLSTVNPADLSVPSTTLHAMATPFTPENIACGNDGRFYHDGIDVTDRPVAWQCPQGHEWWATLAIRTSPDDPGCPGCNPPPGHALIIPLRP